MCEPRVLLDPLSLRHFASLSSWSLRQSFGVHRCAYCQETFPSKSLRKKHSASVHANLLCSVCGGWCLSEESLRRHVRRKHPRTAPDSQSPATLSPLKKTPAPWRRKRKRPAKPSDGRSPPQRKERAKAPRPPKDAQKPTPQVELRALYPTHCAVCDTFVPGWVAHVSSGPHQKRQREADVAAKRRMGGYVRARIVFDKARLEFDFDSDASSATQTLKVTNAGQNAVVFSPWIRGKFFRLKSGSGKRRLEPATTDAIEIQLRRAPRALIGRRRGRLDLTFQLPGKSGKATATRPISA
ncbi:hypothetical protein DFH09DRAFT_1296315 [Mycena vulgaris]|nr:hypothetical protein DFH09DRAFT_1296315 [Mycena vulgaris]